jgi:uncharacterized membrane protein YhaH (DUF805 family)
MFWYLSVLFKYAVFDGRSHREEYWTFVLFDLIIILVLIVLSFVVAPFRVIFVLYMLAVVVPGIAVAIRRLHDIGRSGWWLLISLIPIIGWIVVIVYMAQDSQPGTNQYGPNPKGIG